MNWRCRVLLLIVLGTFLMNTCTVWAMAEADGELLIIECDTAGGMVELEYSDECSRIDCDYMEWMLNTGECCRLRVKPYENRIARVTVNGEAVSLTDDSYTFVCEDGMTEILISYEECMREESAEKADTSKEQEALTEAERDPLEEKTLLTENTNKVSAISYDATVTYLNGEGHSAGNVNDDGNMPDTVSKVEIVNEISEYIHSEVAAENCVRITDVRNADAALDGRVLEIVTPVSVTKAAMEEPTESEEAVADDVSASDKSERVSYEAAPMVHNTEATENYRLKRNGAANHRGFVKTSAAIGEVEKLTTNVENPKGISMNSLLCLAVLCCMIVAKTTGLVFKSEKVD